MLQDRYVDTLVKEFALRKNYLKDEPIHTIYIGGGTPSLLTEENLMKIHNGIYSKVEGDGIEEFTIECNPDDITPTLASLLHDLGVTRVSMGIQTFNDERLRFLHRRHRSEQIPRGIKALRDAGIKNISIDMMFGFPEETLEDWRKDIDEALSLGVEHISAYSLMYEEGTPLYKQLERGIIKEIDEETSAEMYDMLVEKLTAAGYEHYEISNFARSGFQSVHNSSYWNGTHYIGLGAAAHSYNGETRGWNVSNIEKYIDGESMETEILSEDTKYNDIVTTALRTRKGINLCSLQPRYYNYIIRNARKSISEGLLVIDGDYLHLTKKGLYVSDDVMSDLIYLE